MKTKSETSTTTPAAPKIPELQRDVNELKERLAAAKKRVVGTKESHKRAKKAFKLAKREAKSVRKKLKSLKRALDEATVAAITPRINSSKKPKVVVKKTPHRPKTKASAKGAKAKATSHASSKTDVPTVDGEGTNAPTIRDASPSASAL